MPAWVVLPEEIDPDWERVVQAAPDHGYQQSLLWSHFGRTLGWTPYRIGLLDQDLLIGVALVFKCPLTDSLNYLYIPEGPCLPYHDPDLTSMLRALQEAVEPFVDREGPVRTSHLRLEPRIGALPSGFEGLRKAVFNFQPRSIWAVSLAGTQAELYAAASSTLRSELRKAIRDGVGLVQTTPIEGLPWLLPLQAQTRRRHGIPAPTDAYLEALATTIERHGDGLVMIAHYRGEAFASELALRYGRSLFAVCAASGDAHREKKGPGLIRFSLMDYGREHGCSVYDLGAIAPDLADPAHPWHGMTRFKRGFGGAQVDFIGAYDHVYDAADYETYLECSGERSAKGPRW